MKAIHVTDIGCSADRIDSVIHLSFDNEEQLNITRKDLDDLKIQYVILAGHILIESVDFASLKEFSLESEEEFICDVCGGVNLHSDICPLKN